MQMKAVCVGPRAASAAPAASFKSAPGQVNRFQDRASACLVLIRMVCAGACAMREGGDFFCRYFHQTLLEYPTEVISR